MPTRRNKRKSKKGGSNPLRKRLTSAIKTLIVSLACASEYVKNPIEYGTTIPGFDRFKNAFNATKNIDLAIDSCIDEMINATQPQTTGFGLPPAGTPGPAHNLASKKSGVVIHAIVDWFGLDAFNYLTIARKTQLAEELFNTIYPGGYESNLLSLLLPMQAKNTRLDNAGLVLDLQEGINEYL